MPGALGETRKRQPQMPTVVSECAGFNHSKRVWGLFTILPKQNPVMFVLKRFLDCILTDCRGFGVLGFRVGSKGL